MKRTNKLAVVSALMLICGSAAAYAAETADTVDFDQQIGGIEQTVKGPGFPGGHQNGGMPGNNGGFHQGHGFPGGNDHPNGQQPGHQIIPPASNPHAQPNYPQPGHNQPGYPQPAQYGDLRGFCQDYDHSQFMAAKNFAYSGSGLNYGDQQATQWAMNYDQTHACGTMPEYSARYAQLYNYAYGGSYLNMTSDNARDYALRYVETMSVPRIQAWQNMFTAVYQFFYSGSYLNDTTQAAIDAARTWNERGYCGDAAAVESMKAEYARQYNFAYSGGGLNYTSDQAKAYALGSVRGYTSCADLLR